MIRKINKHLDKNDKLLKHGLILLTASLSAGFLNYVYQIYMGRTLGPEQYGILGALFSIIYMEQFSLGSIDTVTSKLVSEYKLKNKFGEIKALFYFISSRLLALGVIVSIFVIIFRNFIAGYLNLPSTSMIYLLALILLISFLGPVVSGMLNGMQFFIWTGATGFIGSLIKLIGGVALVYYGLGVNGALLGLFLGLLVPIIVLFYPMREIIKAPKTKIDHFEMFKYAIPAIVIVMAITMIVNLDVVLVKHKFSAFNAGIYAAASALAKIIWFASVPLVTVMLPKVSNGNGKVLLRQTLFYVALIGAGLSAFYFIAPTFLVRTLFGASYLDAVQLVGLFGISIALFSVNNVLTIYNLAVKRLNIVYFAILALVIEIIAINYVATTILEVVKIVLIVNIVLLLSMLVYTKDYLVMNRA